MLAKQWNHAFSRSLPEWWRREVTEQAIKTLKALHLAEAACTRCPLYKNATQVVSGEGATQARVMLVGEQPGDQEDKQGLPFVGPAGRILSKALTAAGISRNDVFVTNAVKHFKFEPRGKRRLHKRPNAYEIDCCHWWLDFERKLVKPSIVVAMGATAVRSVSGRPLAINRVRGQIWPLADGGRMVATIHPSYILRIQDERNKQTQYRQFVGDLKICTGLISEIT